MVRSRSRLGLKTAASRNVHRARLISLTFRRRCTLSPSCLPPVRCIQSGEAWLFLFAVILSAALLFTSVFFVSDRPLSATSLVAREATLY